MSHGIPTLECPMSVLRRRDGTRHCATRGMTHTDEEARMREELCDELIRDLEHVSRDVRDTVALFLQDLRDDCVDWRWVGDRLKMWSYKDKERFFREFAGPCMRATRVTGSECLKFAHEHGAPWDKSTCARAEWTFGMFDISARARVLLGSLRQGAERSRYPRRRRAIRRRSRACVPSSTRHPHT
jgi:hypothetical protein